MLSTPTLLTRKKLRLLLLLAIAVMTTVLLAGGLAGLELLPGEDFPLAAILQGLKNNSRPFFPRIPIPINFVRLLIGCVWLLFFLSVIIFIISPEARKEMLKRVMRYLLFFLLVYGMMRIFQDFQLQPVDAPQDSAAAGELEMLPPQTLPTPPDFVVNPPDWLVSAIIILLVSLTLAIAWFVWRYFAGAGRDPDTPLERLAQEAQEALRGLQAGGDLKDIIMRCYAEMSQVLNNERGLRRQQAMTPREFEQYLAQSGLDSNYIQRLTRLFEGVRYGSKPAGPQEEQEAIACLTAIVQTYGRS
jgi:hypothetical protein